MDNVQTIAKQLYEDYYADSNTTPIILTPHEAGMLIYLIDTDKRPGGGSTYDPTKIVEYSILGFQRIVQYHHRHYKPYEVSNTTLFKLYMRSKDEVQIYLSGDITPVPYTILDINTLYQNAGISVNVASPEKALYAIKQFVKEGLNIVDAIRLVVYLATETNSTIPRSAKVLELKDIGRYLSNTADSVLYLTPAASIPILPVHHAKTWILNYAIRVSTFKHAIVFTTVGGHPIQHSITRLIDEFAAIVMLYNSGWIAIASVEYSNKQQLEKDRLLIAKRVGEIQAVARAQEFAYAPAYATAKGFKESPIKYKEALWQDICNSSTTYLTPKDTQQLIQTMKELEIYEKYNSGMSKHTLCTLIEGQYNAEYGTRLEFLKVPRQKIA